MRRLLVSAVLLLGACNRETDEPVDPVPPQTAESANRLMSEAEQAAGNASAGMNAVDASNSLEERQ